MQPLSPAETEVLSLLSLGKPIKEIAKIRGCSTRTIDAILQNAREKLRIRSRTELIVWAVETRIAQNAYSQSEN